MRAVWVEEFGGPEVLVPGEAPDAEAGPGQALVEVAYANITFVETQLRSGTGPFAPKLPAIPGNGVGGTVRAVGPGVDPALAGRRVVTSTGGSGAYAELVAVPADGLVEVPAPLRLDDAVALLADGRTATWLMRASGAGSGDRVLVTAAAGGVGTLLVQLATAAGAQVVAAAGGDRKVALATALGAKVAVDYRRPDWTERVRESVGGVDLVLDGVGGALGRSAFDLLGEGGRMLSFGLASGTWTDVPEEEARRRGVRTLRPALDPADVRDLTERALRAAADGRLHPVIGQRFELARAAEAHAAIEARATVGKTLLEVRPEQTRE
ncbi:NADPH2:quinone reductase [Actinopolymorpha cephalotaxi]|uniref:NADPH2:quinone reductase n=1 Tax=Actinopolymorpha cephalotaxi TaxID=504797 RepID=A0A1I2MC64_9ACTN|nr:zinc-binding dehydrogenase [Actinopolymorpha cephalotaxi]NYH81613.1 NADPH2:quinone reductase [Actinopolymorpha cephalotaxi]SFF87137.1 NADPH2:quinone reductase [Actinopolymorpha cephalotaxi]